MNDSSKPVAAVCGQNPAGLRPGRVGCGGDIATCVEVFRCTDCETPFHHECAEKHFAAHKDPPCIYCTSQPDDGTPCPCHHAPCVHDTNQARKERDELVFAVKVLACHYAGALDTASAFAARVRT
jgi:hypothetical protein